MRPLRSSRPFRSRTFASRLPRRLYLLSACFGLTGCSLRGAPSYSLFGAFFPAWLLCAGLGLIGAALFRALVISSGLEDAVPLKLLVYTAFAAGLAVWLWLGLFGDR